MAMLLVHHILTLIISQTLCSAAPSQPSLVGQCGACCHDNTLSALPYSQPNVNNAVAFLEGNHLHHHHRHRHRHHHHHHHHHCLFRPRDTFGNLVTNAGHYIVRDVITMARKILRHHILLESLQTILQSSRRVFKSESNKGFVWWRRRWIVRNT